MFGPNFWLHGQRNAAMFYWSHYTRAVRIKLKNTTDLFYRLGSILVTFLVIYLWFIYKVVEYISISPRDLQVQAGFVCGARSFSILKYKKHLYEVHLKGYIWKVLELFTCMNIGPSIFRLVWFRGSLCVYLVTLTHSDFIRLPVKLMPKENRLLLHMEYWAFHCTDSFSNSLVVELQVSVQIHLYFCHILVEF